MRVGGTNCVLKWGNVEQSGEFTVLFYLLSIYSIL